MTALFSYRNYVDDPDCVLFENDFMVDGYPLDNLKIRGLGDQAVFANVVDVIVEFSIARTVHIVAMLGGGAPEVNFKRLRLDKKPVGGSFAEVVDIQLVDDCRILGETGQAAVFPDGLELLPGEQLRILCYWMDVDTSITQPRVGRMWIGPALFKPVKGDWSLAFRDSGALDATGGQNFVEEAGVRTRVLNVSLAGLPTTRDMFGFDDNDVEVIGDRQCLQGMQMIAGTTGEVIVIPRIDSPLWVHRTMVYGHIESPFGIGHASGPYWNSSLTVVEER
jgi:hypothetical protein